MCLFSTNTCLALCGLFLFPPICLCSFSLPSYLICERSLDENDTAIITTTLTCIIFHCHHNCQRGRCFFVLRPILLRSPLLYFRCDQSFNQFLPCKMMTHSSFHLLTSPSAVTHCLPSAQQFARPLRPQSTARKTIRSMGIMGRQLLRLY